MDLMELLEKGDVESFNAQRPEGGKLDLFAADLAEKDLTGIDLSRANVDKSDFTGSDLTDSTLLGTSLTSIDGSGMKLCHTLAIKARFRGAWMDEADLTEGDFTKTNFTEANLEGSVGPGVVFGGARLVEANAKNATWPDADLVEAILNKTDFSGADLRRADFTEATAHEANFSGAKLDGAVGAHARFTSANLTGASLVAVRFGGANLSGANLSGADLSNADLTGANLTGANLAGAILAGAVLTDAVLDGVSLEGIDLKGADLSGIDPTALGLTKAQLGQVSAVGVEVPIDTAVSVKSALAASAGGSHAVMWENQDGGEATSLRYAVFAKKKKKPVTGVLPVPADKVLARSIGPDGDGFRLAVLRDRPGGVALVCYRIDASGVIESATSDALGYEPMVWPVLGEDNGPVLWGIARRGPTLVVHRPGGDGFVAGYSTKVPTARGFLGRHHPMISCKGGVIQHAGPKSAGTPKRTPDGFPGRLGTAAPAGDRLFCAWVEDRVGDAPGGIRISWLERRGAPEAVALTNSDLVLSLDVLGVDETVWVAWVEIGTAGGQVWRCQLPDGDPEKVADGVDAARVCFATVASGVPALVVTTAEDTLVVLDAAGARQSLE